MVGLGGMRRKPEGRRNAALQLAKRLVFLIPLLALILALPAFAEDEEDEPAKKDDGAWLRPPQWLKESGVVGRYVGTPSGSTAKYLEDHNIQSGPVFTLGVGDELSKNETLYIEGMAEPLQDQGYLLLDYSKAEGLSFTSDIQAWREYYNTRTGNKDETVFGTPIDPAGIYPNTINSTHFYGGGKPKADWLRTRTGVALEVGGPVNDVWADFLYRRVKGEMSMLKGGSVSDPNATPPIVDGSGPGSVLFDVSSRQQIDFNSYGGVAGMRAALLGLNWRFDASGIRHDLKSRVNEPNFGTDASSSELEIYKQNTHLNVVTGDAVASRNLRHDLFVFGGTSFTWERSDPDPSTVVQDGVRAPMVTAFQTRQTLSADITRFSEALTGGAVYTPIPSVIIRGTATVRASQQDGNLNESRDESTFPTGDVGVIRNDGNRNGVSARGKLTADWHAMQRLTISGLAQYDFRWDDVRTTRVLNFTQVQPAEIEDYTMTRNQARAGVDARYRFRRGRVLNGGYEFTWVGINNDINTLQNQFIMGDSNRYRNRIYLNASGPIAKKVRGELRAQYIFEKRSLDAPSVQPPDFATSSDGDIELQGFTVTPVLTYQHNQEWSGVLTGSVGRFEYKLVNDGPAPVGFNSRFSGFQYKALTETATTSINWVPSERFTNTLSYTLYHNSEDVDNIGHDAMVKSTFKINETWDTSGSVRYLSFIPDRATTDDYHTIIVSMGLTGRF
jgi:hypothetical protein